MASHFIEQVQLLMQTQQMKQKEMRILGDNNHYKWLCTRKIRPVIWVSTKDEFLMRQSLRKITEDQQVQILKQLLMWIDSNPQADCLNIPVMCLKFLNQTANLNMINEANFSRMNSFRMSLRRLSIIGRNRIDPVANSQINMQSRRSVTFNDKPIIHQIFNH